MGKPVYLWPRPSSEKALISLRRALQMSPGRYTAPRLYLYMFNSGLRRVKKGAIGRY